MYADKRIVALIPARGGSKGLPRKNILPLHEKPLIAWTIEQAKASQCIDMVLVSTDDEEIAEVARCSGAMVPFLRPAELAGDGAPVIDTVAHAVRFLEDQGQTFDVLALLEATSPLRKRGDLDKALELLVANWEIADCLVSLGEVHLENPFITRVVDGGFVRPFTEGTFFQRQQLPTVYFPYGVIYASKVQTLLQQRSFSQPRTIPYFIERWQNYEIDDIYDFLCVESIMKKTIGEIL